MKIIIKELLGEDENNTISMTNEGFNIDSVVTLSIGEEDIDVPIDELYSASRAFYEDRKRHREMDKLYS